MTLSDQVETGAPDALIQLMSPAAAADPYPIYSWLRETAPVYRSQFGAYLVSRYADVQYVLKHAEVFPGAHPDAMAQMFPQAVEHEAYDVLVSSLVGSNPPKHTRLRKLIGHGFTSRRVADMQASMERWSDRLVSDVLERLVDGATVDLHTDVSVPMPMHMMSDLLGIPEPDRESLARNVPEMMNVVDPAATPDAVRRADEAFRELGTYFDAMIAQRRRDPRDDLVSALVQVRDAEDGSLDDAELRTLLFTLWSAGFETTATAIDNAMLLLLEDPGRGRWLDTEDGTRRFVEETLRFESSVQVAPGLRFTGADVELGGVVVPQGSQVRLLIGSANRDPEAFPDADVFDPGRTGPMPLSFGAGIHYCLGAGLARLEIAVLLRRLRAAAPGLVLAAPPVRRRTIPLRDFASLPVRLRQLD
ncbi:MULTISPECIES: cytochrome P450 [Micromonospora]|uniref:cytochrome P450 n=1 Tax=Micromonospora TaxID=1873 RepID=UPI0021C70248|nr:cytochrome P450 [Micromonospora sp. Mcm103]